MQSSYFLWGFIIIIIIFVIVNFYISLSPVFGSDYK